MGQIKILTNPSHGFDKAKIPSCVVNLTYLYLTFINLSFRFDKLDHASKKNITFPDFEAEFSKESKIPI